MSLGSQINYKQLLQRHKRIRVPMIQRDYAQGRPAEKEVREEFLKTLKDALQKPSDDATLPLNLDFIYGSVEGDQQTRFMPLDGQQRLTTLFLLHWYLAWTDDQWPDFEQLFFADGHSRFAYSVRTSSNEFFDQLLKYHPSVRPESVTKLAELIADQPWYFRSWRLDPTIQAVLHMLDVIHQKFCDSTGLFGRLLDEVQPAITFQLLDLENFGLSDDLYIKMNARGKPLTAFETFKARYEQELKKQHDGSAFSIGEQSFCVAEYVARRMDTTWADLFWKTPNRKGDLYDDAFMNVFRAVALITRDPDSEEYLGDFSKLRTGINPPSYTDFHSYEWLNERFTLTIIHLLDSWGANNGNLRLLLPDERYFDEKGFFAKIVSNGANLLYAELVQFTAYTEFIVKHYHNGIDPTAFQEWMRIIQNLSLNTSYNRPDDFRRSIRGIAGLLEHSSDMLTYFAQSEKAASGFSELQIAEEKLKAKLILAHEGWRTLIEHAESHGYFRGQIGFLLDFSGVVSKTSESELNCWASADHETLQASFVKYRRLAETMFSAKGLIDPGKYRWQRALLCIGDYLLPSGRNSSFLVNSMTDEASWKRLLSGTGNKVPGARNILKRLWEKLSPELDISQQLDEIINACKQSDPWRESIILCPEVFSCCEQSSIRWDDLGTIYLLKRSRMNGSHAELFTFCLYHKLGWFNLKCLKGRYEYVNGTYSEPNLQLDCNLPGAVMTFTIKHQSSKYLIEAQMQQNGDGATLGDALKAAGFSEIEDSFQLLTGRLEIGECLQKLDATINSYYNEGAHA